MSTPADDTTVANAPPADDAGARPAADAPAVAASASDDLDAKRARLKASQEQIAELGRSAGALQDEIKALEAKIADMSQARSAYERARDVLQARLAKAGASVTQALSVAQAVIKNKADIDKAVADFDAALDAREAEAKEAAAAADTAARKARDAQAGAVAAQQDYDALKARPQQLAASLATAEDLLVQANRAQGQNDYAALYFIAGEAGKAMADVRIDAPDDYVAALQDKQDEASTRQLAAAEEAARSAAAAAKAAELARRAAGARSSPRAELLATLPTAP
jgi:DNA repair exonuclease SbcCD ATPase subunit